MKNKISRYFSYILIAVIVFTSIDVQVFAEDDADGETIEVTVEATKEVVDSASDNQVTPIEDDTDNSVSSDDIDTSQDIIPEEVLSSNISVSEDSVFIQEDYYGSTNTVDRYSGSYKLSQHTDYNDNQYNLYIDIANAIYNNEKSLSVVSDYVTLTETLEVYEDIKADYLEWNDVMLTSFSYTSAGYVDTFSFSYSNSDWDYGKLSDEVDYALSLVDEDMNGSEKALVFYSYLTQNVPYDIVNFNNKSVPAVEHTMYGPFVKRMSVCDGFAKAYSLLLNYTDVPHSYAVGPNHAWVMLCIDDKWYHSDPTWDSETSGVMYGMRAGSYEWFRNGNNKHGFADDKMSSWVNGVDVTELATDDFYNYYWWYSTSSELVFHKLDDDSDIRIYYLKSDFQDSRYVKSLERRDDLYNSTEKVRGSIYDDICSANGKLYGLRDNNVYQIDWNDLSEVLVYTLGDNGLSEVQSDGTIKIISGSYSSSDVLEYVGVSTEYGFACCIKKSNGSEEIISLQDLNWTSNVLPLSESKRYVSQASSPVEDYTYKFNFDKKSLAVSGLNKDVSFTDGVIIPDNVAGYNVTEITASAFNGLSSDRLAGQLILPSSIKNIGANAFEGCSGLTGDLDLSNVTGMGDKVFYNCTGLNGVVGFSDNLGYIPWNAFYGCKNIKEVTSWPKSYYIGYRAFRGCKSLEKVADLSGCTNFNDECFTLCSKLSGVIDVSSCNDIGRLAFYDTAIVEVYGLHGKVESSAFEGCSKLTKLTNVHDLTEIQDTVFNQCTSLSGTIDLSGVKKIGNSAFAGCGKLSGDINLSSATSIGTSAFSGCDNLSAIIFSNPDVQATDTTVYPTAKNVMVYVVQGSAMEKIVSINRNYGEGYRYIDEYADTKCVVLDSASLSLDGSISINYYLQIPSYLLNDSGAYIMVGDSKYLVSELSSVSGESGVYKLSYPLAAKNIKDEYDFSVYNGNAEKQIIFNSKKTEIDSGVYKYSVNKYCENIIIGDYSQEQKDIARAIITYGEYSMDYFEYNNQNISLSPVPDLTNKDLAGYEVTYSGNLPDDMSYIGCSLLLKSNIRMRMYFVSSNSSELLTYIATINGKSVDITRYAEASDIYYIESLSIPVGALGRDMKVNISDCNNSYTIKISPLSYMHTAISTGDAKLINLCSSLYELYKLF